jgi:malonyl-CoA decarboxylase
MTSSFLGELLQSISDRGRSLLDFTRERRVNSLEGSEGLVELCDELLSRRGEASGVALAREILGRYEELTPGSRLTFFEALATRYGVDRERLNAAFAAWQEAPSDQAAVEVHHAAEPWRQELFRRLNLAPNGTAVLVRMREQIIDTADHRGDFAAVDSDFVHLFSSWLASWTQGWYTSTKLQSKIRSEFRGSA